MYEEFSELFAQEAEEEELDGAAESEETEADDAEEEEEEI